MRHLAFTNDIRNSYKNRINQETALHNVLLEIKPSFDNFIGWILAILRILPLSENLSRENMKKTVASQKMDLHGIFRTHYRGL